MKKQASPTRGRRRLLRGVVVGGILLALCLGVAWYSRSEQFQNYVRHKVIAYLESATSGQVELGSLQWNLGRLEIEANDLTIHGREAADQLPFAHADHLYARIHIVSLTQAQVTLRELVLTRPVIHLIVYPDGTTNAPEIKPSAQSSQSPVQLLFDLAIRRADLRRGMLLLNQRQLPLDFSVNDVDARLVYDRRARRYDGRVQVGRMEAQYQDWRDVAAAATMEFSLWQNTAQINSFKLTSQKSSLELAGKLEDFNHPQIRLTYDTNLDLSQVGSIIRDYELRSGTVSLSGSGNYSGSSFDSTGRIAIRGLEYASPGLTLQNATLNSNFSLDRNRITLTRIAARALGGQISGDAEVQNYAASPALNAAKSPTQSAPARGVTRTKQVEPTQQKGTAHLRIVGASLADLARMVSTRAMPYSSLKPAGAVGGTVDLNWTGSWSRATANLSLDVAPPTQPSAGELPVTAIVRGQYSGVTSRAEFSTLTLSTPHTQVKASGEIGARSVALHVDASTTSLTEFQPLLTALGNAPPPLILDGQASFSGNITGQLQHPGIAGHVEATNFAYIYTPSVASPQPVVQPQQGKPSLLHRVFSHEPKPAAPSAPKPHNVHIDFFAGDLQYASTGVTIHKGVLEQGGARVNFDGSTSLQNGSFTDNSTFQVQATLHNADVAALQQVIGVSYPLSGIVNLSLGASGTVADPQGHGQVRLESAEAYGRSIKLLTANLVFANHEAQFHDIHLEALRGEVQGSAAVNLAGKTFRFDLQGHSVDLASVPELQAPRFTTAGTASFTAQGSGPWDSPNITAHLELTKLVLNGEVAGELVADAVTHGAQLQLSAHSNFPRATLELSGNVELRGDLPADLTLRFQHLDIDPFLRVELRGRITGHSSMEGEARLSGPLREPRKLNATLRIDAFNVEVQKVSIASDGPIQLAMRDQVITVESCNLLSEDSQITIKGSADLRGDRPLDFRANGHVNMKLVQTVDPDITAYGTTDLDMSVHGTAANPQMTGRIGISHVGLSMIDLPAALGDLNGSLVLNDGRVELEKLTGRTGGGLVTFGGVVTFGRTIGFDITADGNDIRFRYSGVSVTSDQSLRLNGTLQNAVLTGDITITRFAQIPSSDWTLALARSSQTAQVPNPSSPLNNLHFDVRILSAPELTVQTSLAKLSGDVDLRLRGTPLRPVLLGRINIAEGDINLNGAKYHLERGDITFADPVRINPILDVEATTHVSDYDITIGLHGTMEKLNTTYRSDPPLSSDDIIALLAFGRTQAEGSAGGTTTIPTTGFAESASNAILGQAINAAVTNRVSKLFGVSSIKINPAVGGPDNNPNARLTVQQQVSNNITITYITNLTQSAQQVIQFEYNINPQYTFIGTRDENGVVSFDVVVRQRRR